MSSTLIRLLFAQQVVAQISFSKPHHGAVIMNKNHFRICETSCFVIVQQAVAQKISEVDHSIGQQPVAQKVWV